MQGSFEKTILEADFPFRLFFCLGNVSTPHHWHEDIEIIYLTQGEVNVGIGNDIYTLRVGDILIIGSGEIHYFFKETQSSSRAVIQFRMSIYDTFLSGTKDNRMIKPMFNNSRYLTSGTEIHTLLEKLIKDIINEHNQKKDGYKLFLKARLYDLAGVLFRNISEEKCAVEKPTLQKDKLLKLDKVFQYVEKNYENAIDLKEIAEVAGFSKYYFTKFFKENTGVTFMQYLNHFRIAKSEWLLLYGNDSVIDISYKAGFNSVKSFNRVFKELKGCTPVAYRNSVK